MRLFAIFLVACQTSEWEHKETCLATGVTATMVSLNRQRLAYQLYPLAARLGMEAPVDEAVVRVCNGGRAPIYVYRREPAGCSADALGIEVGVHRALVMNLRRPSSGKWFEVPPVEIEYAADAATRFGCGVLIAQGSGGLVQQ
jgi:hypothetical protein